MLKLRAPNFTDHRIIQRGNWILRSSTGQNKAATIYTWDQLDERPTPTALDQIEPSIRRFTSFEFDVVHQAADLRPVIRVDNRPIVGTHPANRRVAALNGLRSKGVLQAPFASRQLIGNLEKGGPIHPEFDVCRKSLWQ